MNKNNLVRNSKDWFPGLWTHELKSPRNPRVTSQDKIFMSNQQYRPVVKILASTVSLGLNLYLELWSPESCLISLWLSVLTVKPESQSYHLKIFLLFGLNKVIKVHSITVIVGMAQYNVGQTFAITMCVKAMLLPSHMLTRIFSAQPCSEHNGIPLEIAIPIYLSIGATHDITIFINGINYRILNISYGSMYSEKMPLK